MADKESGGFQIGPLPPGRYRLQVKTLGNRAAEVEDLSARECRDLGMVRLKAAAS